MRSRDRDVRSMDLAVSYVYVKMTVSDTMYICVNVNMVVLPRFLGQYSIGASPGEKRACHYEEPQ